MDAHRGIVIPISGGFCRRDSSPKLSAAAALGEKIFKDASLSASGRQSCATCHDADSAHSAGDDSPVPLGGSALDQQGARHTPTIRYFAGNKTFALTSNGSPSGGFFWDGRVASLAEQAGKPFLNAIEMANADRAEVVKRLARADYAVQFRTLYGAAIFDDAQAAFSDMTLALQQFQLEDIEFNAFDSKYDEYLRGRVSLNEQEMRGLNLFNDASKGNCSACHPSKPRPDGSHPLFTDFSYINLGVPRNPQIARNGDPTYFDLGLCARAPGDLQGRADLCGACKVPTLRNVAQRKAFFHNGRFKSLKQVLTFYVQRDTNPEKWYPINADGSIAKFDDLIAFLRTLDDGFVNR